MTVVFLLLLGLAWVAVILPATLRASQATPLSATERFRRKMRLLAPRTPRRGPRTPRRGRWVVVPGSSDRLARSAFRRHQKRRRTIFEVLGVAVLSTFVAAVIGGGPLWELHLALDASLAFYVVLLLETKRRRTERVSKVATLEARRGQREKALVYGEMAGESS